MWHVFPDGSFADWNNPAATPQTIGEALLYASAWGENRQERVNTFIRQYSLSDEPVNLMVPVYRAGKRLVLLDSTHRVSAVASAGLSFTALLVVLNGPVDERVLPDLRWHSLNP